MAIHDVDTSLLNAVGAREETDIVDPMMFATPLRIDIRRWHKQGRLRDEGASFVWSWQSGDRLLVIGEREAVKLHYTVTDSRQKVSQTIHLAWTDDRPWFVCLCERRATKLYFAREHFVCRHCADDVIPAFRAMRSLQKRLRPPLKRIPVETQLKVLAREGFRCKVCGSDDGLAVVRLQPKLAREEYPEERNATALCAHCRSLFRSLAGRITLGLRAFDREVWQILSDATSPSSLPLSLDFLDEQSNVDSDSQSAPSVWATRKKRTKERKNQRLRVIIRFLAGQSVLEIAQLEHISRWTVRRWVNKSTPIVVAVCRRMVSRAARTKEWREARFWQGCLERLEEKCCAPAAYVPTTAIMKLLVERSLARVAPDALSGEGENENEPAGRDIKEWAERLEALRDRAMQRPAEAEALVMRDSMDRRVKDKAGDAEMAEVKRYIGIERPAADIEFLRRRMWLATYEFEVQMEHFMEAPAEADGDALNDKAAEMGFWAAIYDPIMLKLVQRAFTDELKNRAA